MLSYLKLEMTGAVTPIDRQAKTFTSCPTADCEFEIISGNPFGSELLKIANSHFNSEWASVANNHFDSGSGMLSYKFLWPE